MPATSTRPRALPRVARLMLFGVAVDALGVGLVLPFLVIYLHEVRGISVATVGVLAAVPAVVALGLLGPVGVLVDRVGPRRVQMVAVVCSALGALTLAGADDVALAALAMLLTGVGHAAFWPANQALVADVLPSEARTRFFGVSFTLLNAGIGVGGVLGALYVSVDDPSTFTTVYLLDAVSFLGPLVVLAWPLRHVGGPVAVPDHAPEGGSYSEVLRDPVFRRLLVVVFFSAFVGYGQIEAGMPAFARGVAEVSTEVIGFAFAVNTAVIVGLQFFVLGRISGKRRTRVFMVMSLLWAISWLVLGLAGLVPGSMAASAAVLAFMGLFALGETMLQPTVPAITNDLAPDHLRGRYNAISAGAFQAGTILGPVVAGVLLQHQLAEAYIALLVGGCVAMVWLARLLEQRITPAANGLQAAVAAAAQPEVAAEAQAAVAAEAQAAPLSGVNRHAPLT